MHIQFQIRQFLRYFLVLLLPLLPFVWSPSSGLAQRSMNLPEGFIQEEVAAGLYLPTSFAIAPDGRVFIAQKDGFVRVVHNGKLLPEPFINISHEVNQVADRGMMGIAVHPGFPATPYLYLTYVYEPPEAHGYFDSGGRVSHLLRISADPANPNVHLPGSGLVLLGSNSTFASIGNPNEGNKPPFSCIDEKGRHMRDCLPAEGTAHVINMVRFGPDGALYVSNGGGTQNVEGNMRAQDVTSLAGKILRINAITGQGFASNPFFDGDPGSNRSKVYALGMRNPFRFTLHPSTGQLYVGEVGNDVWEEINRGGPGANFGWPCYEGPDRVAEHGNCPALFSGEQPVTQAIYSYLHEQGLGAAIGGDFYVGRRFPSQYRNVYFFADFNAGLIQYLTFSGGVQVHTFATNVHGPVQLTAAPDGHLYLLSIATGTLSRIRFTSSVNTLPTAVLKASRLSGKEPLDVQFTGNESFDPDGDLLNYIWDFGDGSTSTEPNPLHRYTEPGVYVATLTVRDPRGGERSKSVQVFVGNEPPTATIALSSSNEDLQIGLEISFAGLGIDPEDGNLTGTNLQWNAVLLHRDHVHYDVFESEGVAGSLVYTDHGDNTHWELCLTATDSVGLTDVECIELRPKEVTYTFKSIPSGLPILYAGSRYTTPFKVITYPGAKRFISAIKHPRDDIEFAVWSNGESRLHQLTIQDEDVTLTALYRGEYEAVVSDTNDEEIPVVNLPDKNTRQISRRAAVVRQSAPIVSRSRSTVAATAQSDTGGNQDAEIGGSGSILREWWQSVDGEKVSGLMKHLTYPDQPDGSEFLPTFEAPRNAGKDFGARIHGYIHPPVTGEYRFWIASDDTAELWLSTDSDPANAHLIAHVPGWTNSREWNRYNEQSSSTIPLVAGKRYYIMALHKEADNKDNLAVAWRIPGGSRLVIEGIHLSPFGK